MFMFFGGAETPKLSAVGEQTGYPQKDIESPNTGENLWLDWQLRP